jgi:hypothetical protein
MGIPFTVPMGFLFTVTLAFLFTTTLGFQLTISRRVPLPLWGPGGSLSAQPQPMAVGARVLGKYRWRCASRRPP